MCWCGDLWFVYIRETSNWIKSLQVFCFHYLIYISHGKGRVSLFGFYCFSRHIVFDEYLHSRTSFIFWHPVCWEVEQFWKPEKLHNSIERIILDFQYSRALKLHEFLISRCAIANNNLVDPHVSTYKSYHNWTSHNFAVWEGYCRDESLQLFAK